MPATNPSTAKLTAAHVMTPNPRTCSPFSTVLEAVLLFRDADCGAVPVLDDGKPVGVLTDRDVALALADHEEDLPALPVSEIMSKGAVTVSPEAPLDTVLAQFGDRGVRRLLVVDDANLLQGIIGWADVAPYAPDVKLGHAVTEVVEHP
jgi:CBS domain-containing protein